jgi:SAM-dependent methyltransferase
MTTQISRPTTPDAGTPTGNTYDKYGSTHPIEQRMMRGFMRALDEMLAGLSPRRILEIGVGEGQVMTRVRQRFPGVPLVGLDLPDDDLGADWRQQGLPCMFGDATTLPFPDDSFDLVLAIEVLEHVPEPDNALSELSRVCSGTFVASVPFEPIWRLGNVLRGRYVKDLGNTPGHVNHWTRWGFRDFVESRFHVQQVRSPLPWTMTRAIPR